MQFELGIIGAGNMAEAIVRGVVRAGVFTASQLIAADVSPARREVFCNQLGVRCVEDPASAVGDSRILLLCVKPHQAHAVLESTGSGMDVGTLVISIAAGVSTASIEAALGGGKSWRVVRAMPNTPMLAGEGMVAICKGGHASEDDLETARTIFQTSARVLEVTEDRMDAVTAVSGSGPAYFFYLVEHMVAAGRELGLSEEQSGLLAKQTALGAARLLLESTAPPSELRQKVTTPGGTTAAAIDTFDAKGMGQTIRAALRAAARRSAEMGK